MSGRKGLIWVTAVTVASLLLGGGALNVLADGRGGGGKDGRGGGDQGKSEHQQRPALVVTEVKHHDDLVAQADAVTPPAVQPIDQDERPGLGCGDQNHEHERNDQCKPRDDDEDNDIAANPDAVVVTVADADADEGEAR